MKRTSTSPEFNLKRKLQLVRTTIRDLTSEQLERVNGASSVGNPDSLPTQKGCCNDPYTGLAV